MMNKSNIEKVVRDFIAGSGMFLVAVKVSSSNRITVHADRNEGITIDDCAAIHHHIGSCFDRDVEDYELQVSSPGAESPFVVIEQYRKNEGKKIKVTDNEGENYTGLLKNVTDGGFELEVEFRVKGRQKETRDISFNFEQVKSAQAVISINKI